ncbi:MAG: effector-associated domain EAD1-containing protein [Microcoleus sp.]
MTLTRDQRKGLHTALISAFSTEAKLRQFVKLGLDKNLDVIGIGADLSERVLKLIENAEDNGWEAELIFAARESNPGNPNLSAFVRVYETEFRVYETEYWQELAQKANSYTPEEVDARNVIVEVEAQVVRVIESQPNANDEFMRLLVEIRDNLKEPGTPATAKLKAALPLIPGILSWELELDTESSLRNVFQPIKRMYKKAFDEGKFDEGK